MASYQFPPDLEVEIRQRMKTGRYASEDDVLREALRALKLRDQDVAAVKEAIADMEAGDRGVPFDELVEDFRKRHNIPQDV